MFGSYLTWPVNKETEISHCHIATEDNERLAKQLERFWRLEELCSVSTPSGNEYERLFKQTTRHHSTGWYIVRIPFHENVKELGTSREQAERRLKALERRFQKLPEFRIQYIEFMNEYERLGHMTRIEKSVNDERSFYLPHHATIEYNDEGQTCIRRFSKVIVRGLSK